MKQLVTKGIMLNRTNYGEADRIITVLTTDQGKIRLVAKGVRKIKSRLAGGIELFSINDITYIQGKADLGTLISSRLIINFENIVKDVDRTMYAYDVLKSVNKVTEDSTGTEYFDLLGACLQSINDPEVSLDVVRLWLNIKFLEFGGHTPNLISNQDGEPLDKNNKFTFSYDEMGFIDHSAGPFDARHVKLLRLAARARSPLQLKQVTGSADLLPALVQLTRTMLTQHQQLL